ncbi:MAG: hypothetical protein ABIE36_01865 [Candidatus Diapherotrites archaeon]
MGIFSFIKKIFSEPEKTESPREKIAFSEIETFIKKKMNDKNSTENQTISLIKEKITAFTGELREKIKIVNAVDIELKEKNDKIKSAVNEGRRKYIGFLERFMDNVENIEDLHIEEVTERINSAFLRLNESSGKSYERATILIGKEMGDIKEALKSFSTELITLFNENKEIISTSKRLLLIESKIKEIKEIKENSQKIDEEISNLTNKILEKQKESKEISENIDKIRNSAEYLENIEKEKHIQIEKKEIEKEINELRHLIDFKGLSNFFHILNDRMAIVKLYRDDFMEEFKKDRGNRLLNLLNESKLNNEKIYDKIKQIQDKEQEIEKTRDEIKEDKTQALTSEIEKTNTEINDLKKEIEWAEKKKEKLKTTQEEILNLIRDELGLIGVDFFIT